MRFKPAIWYPISVVLTVVNVGAAWFAARGAEPWHAAVHAGLAVAFGLWAQRLKRGRERRGDELQAGVEALEIEVNTLRQELSEAQERIDFAERLLAQNKDRHQ